MECPKTEFLSILEQWRGRRCLLVVERGATKLAVWMRLGSAAPNELVFKGSPGEEATFDLSDADSFGRAELNVPAALRADKAFAFVEGVRATISGLVVAVLLAR
jgi:hypothetical protein